MRRILAALGVAPLAALVACGAHGHSTLARSLGCRAESQSGGPPARGRHGHPEHQHHKDRKDRGKLHPLAGARRRPVFG
jgi:hypothetical protein